MADRKLSANARRARTLLRAGVLGGTVFAVLAVVGVTIVRGPAAFISAVVAAFVTLVFMGLGQLIQVRTADAPPQQMMLAWLISYVVRVGLPALLLVAASARPELLAAMDRIGVGITTVAVVLGWLSFEIHAFSRLRIPVFDQTDDTADDTSE
ncbi:MAG: hypothetical protein QM695_08570 [Micropruina sp.]